MNLFWFAMLLIVYSAPNNQFAQKRKFWPTKSYNLSYYVIYEGCPSKSWTFVIK